MDKTRCLILDIVMPGMTGLDLQQELTPRGQDIPVLFITAPKGEALRTPAFKQGAYNFATSSFELPLVPHFCGQIGIKIIKPNRLVNPSYCQNCQCRLSRPSALVRASGVIGSSQPTQLASISGGQEEREMQTELMADAPKPELEPEHIATPRV